MKTGIKVLDAMTNKPVTISSDSTVVECAKLMRKYSVGSLLIKEGKNIVGIITELDFVTKVVAKAKNPEQLSARDIMEKDMITITPDKDIYDAMMEMRNNDIRRLPVTEEGKIIGFLTMKDILKIEPQLFDLMVEKIELREEKSKPIGTAKYEEGVCESCGNFSYRLVEDGGSKLCSECRN
ncbi:MAG: CBS domain-containing protein [Nanoarchaeota archaeon]|nr:CBS domain-containing protein [Nanoarchaeota archaeon]MBU1854787.1 CBS domain-containing protein [Nanoarchaeota archaeon]